MYTRASEIICPQSGVGGVTPKPRNDSDEKVSSIQLSRIAPSTIITSNVLGKSSRHMIEAREWPRARAAST